MDKGKSCFLVSETLINLRSKFSMVERTTGLALSSKIVNGVPKQELVTTLPL
jgi:hypothetical protein